MTNAMPSANTALPATRPNAVGTRPTIARPTEATTSAAPDRRAAPIWSGSFAKATRRITTSTAYTVRGSADPDIPICFACSGTNAK